MKCLVCHSVNDARKCLNGTDAAPRDGDYDICAYCGSVAVFATDGNGGLKLRKPTPIEQERIDKSPSVMSARKAILDNTPVSTILSRLDAS